MLQGNTPPGQLIGLLMPTHPRRLFRLLARLWLAALSTSVAVSIVTTTAAAEDLAQVQVHLFTLPESVWQARLGGQQQQQQPLSDADLHTRLETLVATQEAQLPIDAQCTLKDDGERVEWKRGGTRKFTTGWQVLPQGKGLGVAPDTEEERFIGSTVTFKDAAVRTDGTLIVDLALTHHTAPPGMRRINVSQAAEGAERDRLSVEYPDFARLEWHGKVCLTPGWRLVTQVLHVPEEKDTAEKAPLPRHHLLFITTAADAGKDSDDTRQVRQVVIRMPELEAVEIMAGTTTPPHTTEAARVAAFWQAVVAGRARLISDLTTTARLHDTTVLKEGRHAWLPTELDQDFDRLQMPPTSYQEYFTGSSLQCSVGPDGASLGWQGQCIPRGPLMVKWPVSWLRPFSDSKPDPQHLFPRGWLDFHDTFEQSTTGTVILRSPRMQILAIMPPADQVWPGDRAGRWLDVFLAQAKRPGETPPTTPEPEPPPAPKPEANDADADNLAPADPFAARTPADLSSPLKPLPQGQMALFYGIAIGTAEAAQLTLKREPEKDAALLEKLLARVRAGTARLVLCTGSGHVPSSRHTINSARLHQVPTEMPSIPSAWNDTPIGTSLEMEQTTFALHHDIAPPGRSEWKLALDDPLAVMWQPRPRFIQLQGDTPTLHGTHLVGILHVPEVLQSKDSPDAPTTATGTTTSAPTGLRDETLLIFSQHSGPPQPKNDDELHPSVEAEVIVLEMPGASVDEFQGLPGDPPPGEEDDRFTQLMSRVQTGEVRVAAHTLATGRYGRMTATLAELHKHATEFDPPDSKDQPRMRPTALEDIHAGTELEIDIEPDSEPPFGIYANVSLKHSTGLPVEPDLPATLGIFAKDENAPYPAGPHPQETWLSSPGTYLPDGAGLRLRPGQPFCLGARKPPGLSRQVIHVAYLRVRKL